MFRFGCVSGGASLYAPQAQNNLVRVAYEAMASVLGGVQSMFTAAWDEPFALPSEESATLALRTQQILAYETGVTKVADPLGGSYFVEALTDATEERIIEIMADLEQHGGMVRCIEDGYLQGLIADEAFKIHQEIESGERPVVGVNKFVVDEPAPDLGDLRARRRGPRPAAQAAGQGEGRARRRRGQGGAGGACRGQRKATDNLMHRLIDCANAYCTVGEMVSTLKVGVGRVPAAGGVLMSAGSWFWSPSRAWTATTAAPRSSPARCATPASRSSTPVSGSASRTSCRSRCRRTLHWWVFRFSPARTSH